MLPPQAMLARLEHRLPFLTGGPRDAPERQRTLHNTIAWSYDLLELEEQQAFRQLTVFVSGMTLDAAEAVANPEGRLDLFGSLERLVEQSLLRQAEGAGDEPRFVMLETIREFGLEQLEAGGEAEGAQARHAAFFLALAKEADAALHGPTQRIWIERLETEHDNIRSAIGRALTLEPETAICLVAALHWFWYVRGHLTEGRDWTERALATGATAKPEVQARALNWSSAFAWGRADYVTASSRAEQALDLARTADDRSGEGWALINLGVVAGLLGDPKRAAALDAEAEALFTSIGERHGATVAVYNQGFEAGWAGDMDRQRVLFERSLAESLVVGDRILASWTLSSLGNHELERGNLDHARALSEEALATAREFRFGMIEAAALHVLAEVAGEQGDAIQAATYLGDAEVKYREMEHGLSLASGLNSLGRLALHQGNHERARSLFEEALDLARDPGATAAIAGFTHSLGDALRASGDIAGAAIQYRDALVLAQEAGDDSTTTACLTGLAGIAAEIGRTHEATRLFGAVEALRETVGISPSRYEKERQTQDMTTVREALGTEADAAARAAGRALPLEAAVREALAFADEIIRNASTGA
jgi:tetratricopeptide (TPR) repeat protein